MLGFLLSIFINFNINFRLWKYSFELESKFTDLDADSLWKAVDNLYRYNWNWNFSQFKNDDIVRGAYLTERSL